MPQYNGYASWNAWNVALWIRNDEALYRLALLCLRQHHRAGGRHAAALTFLQLAGTDATPDGVRWSPSTVYAAMEGLA